MSDIDPNGGGDPGGGNPPATPETPPETPPGILGENNQFSENWMELAGIEEEYRGPVSNYKTPNDWAKATKEAQRHITENSGRIKPLTEDSTEEEAAAWRQAHGYPDSPEGYKVEKPEEIPEGIDWNEGDIGELQQLAHKHGASPALVRDLVGLQMKIATRDLSDGQAAMQQEASKQTEALKSEWGEGFGENLTAAKNTAEILGVAADSPLLGSPEFIKAMFQASPKFAESKIPGGGSASVNGSYEGQVLADMIQHGVDSKGEAVSDPEVQRWHDMYKSGEPGKVEAARKYIAKLRGKEYQSL